MIFLSNWQKNLGTKEFSIIIILFIFIFIFYNSILFSRLSAQRYLNEADELLQRARVLNNDMLIEKSLFYYKALRLLNRGSRMNTLDPKFYFEYA